LVTLDSARADHLPAYGYPTNQTPTLDALAAHGVRFDQAFTTSPLTVPAHASILSGLYPPETGVRLDGDHTLPDEVETLAERLRAAGWHTAASVGGYGLTEPWHLDQGFELFLDDLPPADDPWTAQRAGDRVTKDVEQHIRDFPKDQPLFLWIELHDPAPPYEAPDMFVRRAGNPYDAEIGFLDSTFSWVKGVVEHWSPDRPYVWIVVGDHGEGFGDFEHGHGTYLAPATIRVPLIVVPAEPLSQGIVVDTPVSVVDVVPTALSLLGLPAVDGIDGVDLTPALDGSAIERGPLYVESQLPQARFGWAPEIGVVSGSGLWVGTPRGGWFDRAADPLLQSDQSATHAAEVDAARAFAEDVRGRAPRGPSLDLAGQATELEALGYALDPVPTAPDAVDPRDRLQDVTDLARARELEAAGRVDEAEQVWRDVLTRSPELVEPRLAVARRLPPDAALPLIEEGVAVRPTPALRLRQGQLLLALGRTTDAEAIARSLIAESPTSRNARELLIASTPPDVALAQVQSWQQATPDDAYLHAKAGQLLLVAGHLEEAEAELRLAAQAPTPWLGVHRALGVIRDRKGDPDGAWKELSEEAKQFPSSAAAWAALGDHLLQNGQLPEAIELYTNRVKQAPDDRRARVGLAEALLRSGNVMGADQALTPLMPPRNPREAEVWANLLAAKGDKKRAQAVIDQTRAAHAP
jgi:Flp pilus assembly protein TadD